jgi:hypothetical protein
MKVTFWHNGNLHFRFEDGEQFIGSFPIALVA